MSTDVNVKIGADISQFQTAMNKVRNQVGAVTEDIASKWANISTAIRNSTRILQESFSILSVPMQEFAKWEDAATRLAPLVGGLSTAKELTSALRDEAANGTMSIEQLASVAGRLATVFSNTEDIRKWTTAFHDLAAGTGMDINELVGNFVRSRASGRFEAGLMDMFAQKGVNIFPELVKQTGQSEVALRKLAAEGKLSFSEVEKAILAVSTGTGQFAGQAAAMSNTFGGSVGTMIANWKILLAEFAKPIAESLTPWIQSLGKFLSESKGLAEEFGSVIVKLTPALLALAGSLLIAKAAAATLNAVLMANPFVAAATAIVTVGTLVYSFLPEAKSLTDMVTESNRKWEDSLKDVKRAYDALTTKEQLSERIKQDKQDIADKEAAFREANPDFDAKRAEIIRWRLESHYRDTGGGWLDDYAFKHVHGYSTAEAEKQVAALLEYNAILKRKEELSSLAGTAKTRIEETARLEAAEAASQAAKDEREAIEDKTAALEKYREQLLKTRQAEALSGMDARERPDAILANAGFGDEQQLDAMIGWKEADLKFAGNAEQAQKTADELKDLYATQEKLNKAKAEADKRQAQADAAANAARQRIALLKAEISGNRELEKHMQERERHERIMQELTGKGVDADEAARIATRTVAMENLQAAGTAGRELIGNGLVTSSQASIGGGRSIQVGGESAAVSIARSQLSVMEKIKAAIDAVEKNTAGGFKPALI